MVAVITGGGLGLDQSSASILGGLGLLGQAGLGRAGDNVYVNAASGNLVISSTDEMLFGTGQDAILSNTYNNQGQFNDDNADNWRESVSRTVGGLTGTINTAGSTITRTDWDGSKVVFTWDGAHSAYIAKEADGAYDTLTLTSTTWSWTNGSSRTVETYDNSNGGRITSSLDRNGQGLTFAYNASGLVSKVTTQTGEYVTLVYSGTKLTELDTFSYANTGLASHGSKTVQSTRVRYGYNASNKLTSVTVDLSPGDNSITDGKTYVITYGYDANGNVNSITQTDGSSLQIAYIQVGGSGPYRVSSLTQTAATGVARVTGFSYDTVNRITTVTDPTGQITKLTYDASGRLLQIDQAPAVSGGVDQITKFEYDPSGNISKKTLAGGLVTTYGYDANGNCTLELDSLGNTITRTFSAANQLLSETKYTTPDPDGTGGAPPSGAETTYYVYDTSNRLHYLISAQGDVTQYNYDTSGRLVSTLQPTATAYAMSGLSPSSPPSVTTVNTWFTGLTLTYAQRTDTTYDFRGGIATTTTYGALTTAGVGVTTSNVSKVTYIYDQAGNLLSQLNSGVTASGATLAGVAQTYAYDGLGRVVTVTDPDNHTTSTVFNDATSQTVITFADTSTQTNVYDLAGELISSTHSASPSPLTTSYKYDAQGNLRISIDPLSQRTFFLYDNTGRKVAQVLPDGALTEYAYDADNNLISTIAYATKLTSTQLSSLVDANGNPTSVGLAIIRPGSATGDARSYNIYDGAGRLIESIGPAGAVVQYVYDGASELISTTAFANLLSAATLLGFKAAPPTTLVLPTVDASADRTSRLFYDADGRQVAALDPYGLLTQIAYDAAGRKTSTLRSFTPASSGLRGSGTLAQLVTSVGTNAADITESYAYDDRGLLKSYTDGAGRTTTYTYDPVARVATVTDGAGGLTQYSYDAAGNLQQKTDARSVVTTYTYDAENRLKTETVEPTGLNLTTTLVYDALGNVTSVTSPSNASTLASVTTTTYDADGRKTSVVVDSGTGRLNLTTTFGYDADGRVNTMTEGYGTAAARTTTYGYDSLGRLTTTVVDSGVLPHLQLTTTRAYDADGNFAAVTDATGAVARFVYNAFGQQVYAIDAAGDVTQTAYDADGRVAQVTAYANALSSTALAALGLTPSISAVASAVIASAGDRTTTYGYDEAGRVTTTTVDPGSGHLSLTTSYVYDNAGDLLSKTDPLGYVTRYVYDAAGRRAYTIDPTGAVCAYLYDADNNLTKETHYAAVYSTSGNPTAAAMSTWVTANASSANDRVTRSLYDNNGRLVFSTDPSGHVTAYAYDADDRVTKTTRYATAYTTAGDPTLAVMQTWATGHGLSGTTSTTGDEITSTTYDTAGRVTDTYDATNVRTHYAYDGLGNVTDVTVAYGTSSAQTTHNTYDTAGRLLTSVVDAGHLNLTTSYGYDNAGRVTLLTDPNGHATASSYDAAGRLLTSIVDPGAGGLNLTTSYQYDAFGDKVKLADPNGASGYFYYDAAGRLTLQIDAAGYATKTVYDADGNKSQVIRYYTATTGAAVGIPPTIASNPKDETTSFGYDHLGRLTSTTDAEGYRTLYVLNTFGQQVYLVDARGDASKTAYDLDGRVTQVTRYATAITPANLVALGSSPTISAVAAVVSTAATSDITTTYAYDARDNRTQMVEAAGLTEARTTNYVYDLDNRQVSQSMVVYVGNALTVPTGSTTTTTTQSIQYDVFGNVVLVTDADLHKTYSYYDAANRKIAQVDAFGGLTTWAYDGETNVKSKIVYRDTVTPTSAGGAPPAAPVDAGADLASPTKPLAKAGAYRQTDYIHDADDRLTSTSQRAVQYGYLSGTTYVYGLTDVIATSTFDADGNVIATQDGNGNWSHFYYDANGRKIGQVDPAGFVTTFQLDSEGNTLTEKQYATAGTAPGNDPAPGHVVGSLVLPAATGDDRITVFTYDRNGRRVTESRQGVLASSVSGTGAVSAASANDTINYTYDGLGNVKSKTEATGDFTLYSYDAFGRQVHSEQRPYTDYRGQTVTPSTDTTYNGLGLVTQSIVRGDSTTTAPDRITTTTYGAGGRAITVTDPTGFVRTNSYDAQGALVAQQYGRKLSNGATETDSTFLTYDAMNREISRKTGVWNGSAWTYGATTDQYYDAYGEVVAQGTNTGGVKANAQKYADYDNGGHVWRTNMTDGVSRAYAYDSNGNATILFQTSFQISGAVDLKSKADLSAIFADTSNSITQTITAYDRRNLVSDTLQPTSNQSYNPIHAVEIDTTSKGLQYFAGNMTANYDAGHASNNVSAGAALTGTQFYGSGGRVTMSSYSYQQWYFIGMDPNTGQPYGGYIGYWGISIDLSNAGLTSFPGAGNCTLYTNGFQYSFAAGTTHLQVDFTGDPPWGYGNYVGPVSVYQDTWQGSMLVASGYNSGPGVTLEGASPRMTFQNVNPNVTSFMAFVRGWGAGTEFTKVNVDRMPDGSFSMDLNQAPFYGAPMGSAWDVRYVGYGAGGQVYESKYMDLVRDGNTDQPVAMYQGDLPLNPSGQYGPGQTIMANSGGRDYLIFWGMPPNDAYIHVHYAPVNSTNWSIVDANNGAWGQAGFYYLDVTGISGTQQFYAEPMNTASQNIGNVYEPGTFTVGGDSSITLSEEVIGHRTYTLTPPSGQGVTNQRFRYSADNGASWSSWILNASGSAWNNLDLSSLADFYSVKNFVFEYEAFNNNFVPNPTPPPSATLQQFRYSTDNGATWNSWITQSGSAAWTIPLGSLVGPYTENTVLYQYETYNGTQLLSHSQATLNQMVGRTTGSFSVGYSGQTTWNIQQQVNVAAKVQFNPQSAAASIKLYWRDQGTNGSYSLVTINSANGLFAWDVDAAGVRPPSGLRNLEFYYDAYAANGTLIPPPNGDDHVHGYIGIQSTGYVTTHDYAIQWVADLSQATQFVIDRKQTWNAFGEISSETDGRNDLTSLAYNTLGKLITKTNPQVNWYDETNTVHHTSPIEQFYYDVSGRQVAQQDANGNIIATALLTNSGYDGGQAQTTIEFDPDGSKKQFGFDAFGQVRTITNGLNVVTDTNTYDGDGNLTEVDHALRSGGNSSGVQLKDFYSYDGLGERIKHTNSVYGSGVVETTDYDAAGRVTKTVDFAALQTTYTYTWNGSLSATGLGTSGLYVPGGWRATTTNAQGLAAWEDDDLFGRVVARQDFGARAYSYTYNYAGELIHQSNILGTTAGQSVDFTYYTNGYVASMTDNVLRVKSQYQYDNDGNRTLETYDYIDLVTFDPTRYYENSVVSYDAMNRISEIKDPKADIVYKYDAAGNRREVYSVYNDGLLGLANDGINHVLATQDFYYKYDSMNRFVLTMGAEPGGAGTAIVTGSTGVTLTYDAAGNRATATYGYDNHTETYSYTGDGYLENTTVGGVTIATRTNDALGRVTNVFQQKTDGTIWSNDVARALTYDRDNRVTDETDTDYTHSSTVTTIHNDYKAYNSTTQTYSGTDQGLITHSTATTNAVTTNTNYYYAWWDQAKQSEITINGSDPANPANFQWKPGESQLSYDVNGHLLQLVDSAGSRTLKYQSDATGQILVREEWDATTLGPRQLYYYFNGNRVGDVGDNGPSASQMDYAEALTTAAGQAGKGGFRFGRPVVSADFDENYQPINPSYPGLASTTYTVRSGDTLQAIATQMWGDANLWYLIGEANGLSATTTLVAGQTLQIPNKVANFHNSATTFKPYNAGEAIGDTLPTLPPEPQPPPVMVSTAAAASSGHKSGGCGILGQILMIVVAIVVVAVLHAPIQALFTNMFAGGASGGSFAAASLEMGAPLAWSAPAIAGDIVGGAVAGGLASAASQGVGLAIGAQDKFNWDAVGLAAVSGGVGGGLGGTMPNSMFGGNAVVGAAARGAVGSALAQGIGLATGLQSKFDWAGVAEAGVGSAAGAAVGNAFASKFGTGNGWQTQLAGGLGQATAGAAVHSAFTGSDFGGSILGQLPSVIGSTIGNAIAGNIQQQSWGGSSGNGPGNGGPGDGGFLTNDQMVNNIFGVNDGGAGGNYGGADAPIIGPPGYGDNPVNGGLENLGDRVTPADEVGGRSVGFPTTQPKDTYLDSTITRIDGKKATVTFNGRTQDDGLTGNQKVTKEMSNVLAGIIYYSDNIDSINVSATTNGHVDKPYSDHRYGDAVDINFVNGVHIRDGGAAWAMADNLASSAMDDPYVRYIEAPSGVYQRYTPGGDWVQKPNVPDQYVHVHISVFPAKY